MSSEELIERLEKLGHWASQRDFDESLAVLKELTTAPLPAEVERAVDAVRHDKVIFRGNVADLIERLAKDSSFFRSENQRLAEICEGKNSLIDKQKKSAHNWYQVATERQARIDEYAKWDMEDGKIITRLTEQVRIARENLTAISHGDVGQGGYDQVYCPFANKTLKEMDGVK